MDPLEGDAENLGGIAHGQALFGDELPGCSSESGLTLLCHRLGGETQFSSGRDCAAHAGWQSELLLEDRVASDAGIFDP